MKSLSRSLLLIACVLGVTASAAEPAQNAAAKPKSLARELSRAEFESLLAKPEQLLIIDVRRPDELTKIGGFPVFLSVQIKDLPERLAWIPKDRTIVTVSNHAARSGRAADLLTANGYKVAGTVGAQTFEEQGGRLTKFEIPPRTAPSTAAAAPAAATASP